MNKKITFAVRQTWRGVRVVDRARLESVCTARYRGFESRPLRIKTVSFDLAICSFETICNNNQGVIEI